VYPAARWRLCIAPFDMFGFFRRNKPAPAHPPGPSSDTPPESSTAAALITAAASESDIAASEAAAIGSQAATTDIAEAVPQAPSDRRPWLARLKQGLSRTRGNIAVLFTGVRIDEALYEDLETALLSGDTGVETTPWLLTALREKVRKDKLTETAQVKAALRGLLVGLLAPLERPIDIDQASPLVMMIAGVNGAGKTTSIGKLARHLHGEGKSVLLAAGDTFRAAAREQLAQWGSRNQVDVIAQEGGDPGAVAFDAVAAGRARGTGVVMVDTAGRLPTQTHLMEELKKIRRVIGKAMDGAPHEVLLVLDGNTGQNMLAQVKAFDDAVQLTGLIVTKLDGTARGGALVALAHTRRDRPIPICFIGVGEGIDDLQAFSADEFAGALID
jgi:fused signal recognition particle receptor